MDFFHPQQTSATKPEQVCSFADLDHPCRQGGHLEFHTWALAKHQARFLGVIKVSKWGCFPLTHHSGGSLIMVRS